MTKRSVLIGLAMAAIVLAIAFIVSRPNVSEAPIIDDPKPQGSNNNSSSNTNTGTETKLQGDNSSDIDAALDGIDSDFNSVDSANFDPNTVK